MASWYIFRNRHPAENEVRQLAGQTPKRPAIERGAIGLPQDLREYGIGAQILLDQGVRQLKLISSSPTRIKVQGYGLEVVERISLDEVTEQELGGGTVNGLRVVEGNMDASGHRYAIVVGHFNALSSTRWLTAPSTPWYDMVLAKTLSSLRYRVASKFRWRDRRCEFG